MQDTPIAVSADTLANLNVGLQGLPVTPTDPTVSNVTLGLTTNNQGNTGSGGTQQDRDVVAITVSLPPAAAW